jgi:hypothetical protein
MRSVWMQPSINRALMQGRGYAPPGMSIIPGVQRYSGPMMYGRDAGQAGDFLGIGKAIHGLLSGPVGSLIKVIPGVGQVASIVDAGAAALAATSKRSKTAGPSGGVAVQQLMTAGTSLAAGGALGGALTTLLSGGGSPVSDNPGDISIATQESRNMGLTSAGAPPAGYHLNKTGYWVNGSKLIPGAHYVGKGTKWVKNRKRNPFNPRAASRSMSRLAGLSHGMKALEKNLRRLAPHPRQARAARPFTRKR